MRTVKRKSPVYERQRTWSLQEIKEEARRPNITNAAVIDRLLSLLTDMPASDFYHPYIKRNAAHTPWRPVLQEMSFPEEAAETLNFGEMMFLADRHLKECDHSFDLEKLTEAQDIEHDAVNRTWSAMVVTEYLARLACHYYKERM